MTRNAIELRDIGKRYRLGDHVGGRGLRETLMDLRPRRVRRPQDFWALRDVSLDIGEGELVGVVGPNGAGKSTLLKILARITEPTTGRGRTRGRVGALLEVGTAFHPELTGRENISINGALLGMTRRDIRARFDDIVEFSGVERFLDTPVKRYSSGMYLRLAFAVAAHFEPEVVVVDEVLAVGDAEFQRRSLGKMSELGSSGRTVLFVSHDVGAIRRLCDRTIWLDQGSVHQDGPTAEVLDAYVASATAPLADGAVPTSADERVRVAAVELLDEHGAPADVLRRGDAFGIRVVVEHVTDVEGLDLAVWIADASGRRLIDEALSDHGSLVGTIDAPGRHVAELRLPAMLRPGVHAVGVWLGSPAGDILEAPALRVDVVRRPEDWDETEQRNRLVAPAVTWRIGR